MALVTLAQAKMQCRVTNNAEDDLLTLHISAAEEWIKNYLDRDVLPVNTATQAAALLIIHDLYENRGATGEKDFKENPAVDRLLWPYRNKLGI